MGGSLVVSERIEKRILLVRGQKVMLDRDLAELYGVETKVLNQAVKRNADRFPEDFMFRLDEDERDQLVTNCDRFDALRELMAPPEPKKNPIGFHVREEVEKYTTKTG